MENNKPLIVNHGHVFGNENWFTFYCPDCKKQLDLQEIKCACGSNIFWDKKEKS